MMENYYCECCGFEVEKYEVENEDALKMNYCESCFYDQYAYCDCCGVIIEKDDAIFLEEECEYYCECCAEGDNIFYCNFHNRYERGYSYDVADDSNFKICEEALGEGYFFQCPSCLSIYDADFSCWCEEYGEYYCMDCYESIKENNKIKSYHEHEDDYEENMLKTNKDKNTKLFFGMELEIENKFDMSSSESLAESILEITNDFVFENDGSLSNGFEIISYPFSKNYMKEKMEEKIIDMLQKIRFSGFDSLDTCGLHFHVSEEAIRSKVDLVLFVEYYKEELTVLSRREGKELSRWSKFYTEDMKKEEITREIIQNRIDDCWSRYRAVNFDNFNTVEFRIFKGTTKYDELLAVWELINNIVTYINNNKIDINNMPSFKDVVTYEENRYISEYMESLGLEF